jgi:amidophosphoribosyltransferase
MKEILPPTVKKSCSFDVFIFQEVVMPKSIKKEKLGKLILPAVLNAIDQDTDNTVFSYIPNTAKHHFMV